MTQLSIFNAGRLVDNQVADFICKNFKMLRKLNLSHAQTDDEEFGEIAGLKGRFLRCGCPLVFAERVVLFKNLSQQVSASSGYRASVSNFEGMWDFGKNFEIDSFPGAALFGRRWHFKGLQNLFVKSRIYSHFLSLML